MRIILLIFALALCFFMGVQHGMEKQVRHVAPVEDVEVAVEADFSESVESELPQASQMNMASTQNTTAYKAAIALESVVDFIYEIIVHFLYQVSKLFY
ncbi:hypothetical protein [Oceanobacillus sp. CAU 1775]